MPARHDANFRISGTRFRIYPQMPGAGADWQPETVWLSPPAGTVRAGPADDRMYVRDAVDKRRIYQYPVYMPPYRGPVRSPVPPGPGGHFDHIPVGTFAFRAAHLYAGVRRVLDIWEGYLGAPIRWHFEPVYSRMELIPFVDWRNAHSGFGFIETGFGRTTAGAIMPYDLNFDVIAHEIGHSILFSLLGSPSEDSAGADYFGFSESHSDMVAMIAALHFEAVVDHLMATTRGNLYTLNELNRLAELSETEQIRVAMTDTKMSKFARGWSSPHEISLPLTGAIFDVLIEVYLRRLVHEGLIGADLARRSMAALGHPERAVAIARAFARAYDGRAAEFKAALLEARDVVGYTLAGAWKRLTLRDVSFARVGDAMVAADRAITGGRHRRTILASFRWREIGTYSFGPRIAGGEAARERRDAERTATRPPPPGLPYSQRMVIALQDG